MWGNTNAETGKVIEFPEDRAQVRRYTWLRRYPAGEVKLQRLLDILKMRAFSLFFWDSAQVDAELFTACIEGVVRRNVAGTIQIKVDPMTAFLTVIASDDTGEYHYGVQLTPEMFHAGDASDDD